MHKGGDLVVDFEQELRVDVFRTAVPSEHPEFKCSVTVTHLPSGIHVTRHVPKDAVTEWKATKLAKDKLKSLVSVRSEKVD